MFMLQKRQLSKIISFNLRSLLSANDSIELQYDHMGNAETITIPFTWFRDHCNSKKLYNWSTNQRRSNFTDLIEQSIIKESGQVCVEEQKKIRINWSDGHISEFGINDILDMSRKRNAPNLLDHLHIWDSNLQIPTISNKLLTFSEFGRNLAKYGVVIVNNVEETPGATSKLCKSLLPLHDTFFGQFWVFSNSESTDEPSHEDTAYGNEEIGPHTDGTYFNQSPGIQVFHCLQPAKTGGDTILVDSFHCAQVFRKHYPEDFDILTRFKIDHHYLEGSPPGSSIHSIAKQRPVIEIDDYGNIAQIRFNPYDRAPFRCLSSSPSDSLNLIQFYHAYQRFSQICHNPKNAVKISLRPGSVIFIDNFRVLHSRTAFKGDRRMCGCYLSRDNFYAKIRPFLGDEIREFV